MKAILNLLPNRATVLGAIALLTLAGSTLAFTQVSKDRPQKPSISVPVDESAIPRDGLPRVSAGLKMG